MSTSNQSLTPDQQRTVDYMVEDVEADYRRTASNLAREARSLAHNMTRLAEVAEAIAENGEGFSINSLGEVQSRGFTVDRHCAILEEQRRNVERLRYVCERLVREVPS